MRYKILLVDDEAWVIESLKASVDWHRHGFEVAGTALSGSEALSMIDAIRPDAVFTDIRMPGMSGLDLIKKGSELPNHRAHYIVVSGYAEFAYAQKALTYGALAYCLKPFDENEIVSILKKIKREKDARTAGPLERGRALQAFLETPHDDYREDLLEELNAYGLSAQPDDGICAIVCALGVPATGRASLGMLNVKIGKYKQLFVAPWNRLDNAAKEIERELAGDLRGVGVSGKVTDIGKLPEAVDAANAAADRYFIAGAPGIFHDAQPDKEAFHDAMKRLGDAIREGDLAAANRAFDGIAGVFREGGLAVKHALHLYNMVHSLMYHRFRSDMSDRMLYSHELLLTGFVSLTEMLHYLRQFVSRYMLESPEFDSQESGNETFRAILQFVNHNYLQDVSIQSLSAKFYTNPSYICQLFKKEVGDTFTSYIARLRITYACELLTDTDLMVGEIAEKAGYPDYFYFTKIFKRIVGKTPSQYRAEMK
ncbi:hypothetical protein B1A99_06910 [Cohnella sp. CIP 111063]|uniref:response regulator n=1 Tax=unclassified Cohnella TaxID=2636738 RepID=UPI000B8C38B7|nr:MULTISPECIES: response regulator [unclassified Cohnella]OXS61236.1 hypothetical protein B1A99_06910 [Cohnella sp. CIP 111063]PRX73807.1 AraC family two component transcriptional regulator [Cohnella sp. SGD-V74]